MMKPVESTEDVGKEYRDIYKENKVQYFLSNKNKRIVVKNGINAPFSLVS